MDHFNLLAPIYDKIIPAGPPDRFTRWLAGKRHAALLDVGGGTGRTAQLLRDHADTLVLVDLSMEMLRVSQRKGGLRPVCGQSERLPFPESSFDCVVMIDALHHVIDQAASAAEMWRVLAPGGSILIQEPNPQTTAGKLIAIMEKILLMRSKLLTPALIAALFDFDGARAAVELDGMATWVVVEKFL